MLATEGDAIDGHVRVLASWKGDLEEGVELILPDLASLADEESRQIEAWSEFADLPEPYVRGVTGAEMVLFLIKAGPSEKESSSTEGN
ncbi:MAG: hypothetical protein IT365_20335, partial [Candidatus Hydrogenedentes bacterium]|nr:hypothetical protein [Candidatus Hydrogenedentota bacterium]